jgi:hypothetical protein
VIPDGLLSIIASIIPLLASLFFVLMGLLQGSFSSGLSSPSRSTILLVILLDGFDCTGEFLEIIFDGFTVSINGSKDLLVPTNCSDNVLIISVQTFEVLRGFVQGVL